MSLTVLFDLDETLLQTNTYQFFPRYFEEIGMALSHHIPHDTYQQQIFYAFQEMEANQDPRRRLSEVFIESVYPPLGTSEEACKTALAEYHRKDFLKLRKIITQNPHASEVISWCRAKDMTVVIATNPLFHDDVIRTRIEWAGLDPNDFAFYTTMDDFHFTKPNLTFYAEVLGRLGWPENGVVMVGDSQKLDLSPMEIFGYPTFLVDEESNGDDKSQGPLSKVKSWLEQLCRDDGVSLSESLEVDLAILRSTPAVIDSWLQTIPEEILRKKPARDEWSVLEVLWHLADMEIEVFNPQWQQILSDPSKMIIPPDTSRWADQRRYQARDLAQALENFLDARLASLSLIDQLEKKEFLPHTIQHSTLSKANVLELISFVVKHDRIHIRQCFNLLNFC
jgi:FMN phosphatase YigB (HAD superfamily)/uncharacterized damage-inducible protein DinB